MNEERMIQMIRETGELFSVAQTVGNRAVSSLGYNQPYSFSPNLTVSYELYTSGPAVPYYSQYDHLNEEELGEQVEREVEITDEQWFWRKEELFKRIVIKEPLCHVAGSECPGKKASEEKEIEYEYR